jgi:tetratricopeptide (TPR) repeat protein
MAVRHRKDKVGTRKLPSVRGSSVNVATNLRRGRNRTSSRLASFCVCLALIAITWFVFGQTLGHDFVNFDDHVYVYENPRIIQGITLDGVIGVFAHLHARNWHPLTSISHMLDCQLFGLNTGGHHFTNVLLHTIAVLLLFLVFHQMTGAFWQSAFVASLFAIHPLHVESVAWISERKDVLSADFFMLTLLAYLHYARRPSIGRYAIVVSFLGLGLMSKPMLVTLPFVLLLLDYWPLKRTCDQSPALRNPRSEIDTRWQVTSGRMFRLVLEKIPLLVLSVFSCAVTLLAQSNTKATDGLDQLPFTWRLSNAVITYVTYVWQMIWPNRLAVFYPHPNDQLLFWQVILAVAFLAACSLLAILFRKRLPYILTGWFWYIGMLVPVIGLIQVGEQARADRYTYLPQIGLYVMIAWAVADFARPCRNHRIALAIAAAAAIAALSVCAFVQTSYWKNSGTLWTHAVTVTSDNDVAHNNLGYLSLRRGELDEAISHFSTALNIRAGNAASHYNLGRALIENNLANALARKGLAGQAIPHYEEAVRLRPDYADAYYNFGTVLFREGKIDEAITEWQKALAIQPYDAEVHTSLGTAFARKGMLREAIAEYQQALKVVPQNRLAMNNLAWLLATSSDASTRDGARAVALAREAIHLSSDVDPNFLRTLAAAFAESGRFSEAVATAEQAMQIATVQGKLGLANILERELSLYRAQSPVRETEPSN